MREREPSQIKMKSIINLSKKKKSRNKFKKMVLQYVPVSSVLCKVAKYFKHWKMKCIRKVSLSGDVGLNPGPMVSNTFETISFTDQNFVLRYRILRHGLQPVDVRPVASRK